MEYAGDGPYVSVREAVSRLGEDGEHNLIVAHVEGKIELIGRYRNGTGSSDDIHKPIPRQIFVTFGRGKSAGIKINLETGCVEADARTTDFAQFERHTRNEWEDVQVARVSVDALVRALNGRKPSSAFAEKKCREWLVGLMENNSNVPPSKPSLLLEAKQKFERLSNHGFNRAWKAAALATNASAWTKAGRRPSSRP